MIILTGSGWRIRGFKGFPVKAYKTANKFSSV